MAEPAKTTADLDGGEWQILHSARDMDRSGTHPTADRLIYWNPDIPEADVRAIRADLIRWGLLKLTTTPGAYAVPQPDATPRRRRGAASAGAGRRKRRGDAAPATPGPGIDPKTAAIALYRVVEGKGSVYRNLGMLLGCTGNAIKCRVDHARNAYTSEELDFEGDEIGLDPGERKYLTKLFKKLDSPEVREFAATVYAPKRARPDRRSQSRDDAIDTPRTTGRARFGDGGDGDASDEGFDADAA